MPQARPTALSSSLHLLHRASHRADSLFAGLVDNALTPRQFAVLQAVAEADGLSQTGIMAATDIDRSSTADLVRRLVSHGWLQRRRTKRDARLYAVRLTPAGRRVWSKAVPAVRAIEETLLSSLTMAERVAFVKALAAIASTG